MLPTGTVLTHCEVVKLDDGRFFFLIIVGPPPDEAHGGEQHHILQLACITILSKLS